MTQMSNSLYSSYADLYTLIADDRDFLSEISRMGLDHLPSGSVIVELFAGPAYHSRYLERLEPDLQVLAVDTMPEMEAVARGEGYSGTYLIEDALASLGLVSGAAAVIVPRFSVALVDDDYLSKLFVQVSRALVPESGLLFIELHSDETVASLLSETEVQSLNIHERNLQGPGGEDIVCVWPEKSQVKNSQLGLVEMQILVKTTKDGICRELKFVSREYLRAQNKIVSLASECGLGFVSERSFQSDSGRYLAFKALTDSAEKSAFGAAADRTNASFVERAFSSRFALGKPSAIQAQLERSGLRLKEHDAPLSCHVYNLL